MAFYMLFHAGASGVWFKGRFGPIPEGQVDLKASSSLCSVIINKK